MKTVWICVFLYTLCVEKIFVATDSASDTLKFVNDAQRKLNLTENQNVTLVVGNTGSGKSTLVHYVAGNYSKLEAVQKDGNLDLTIQDEYDPENGDATPTAVSRTLIPEMMIDEMGNTWFDCPGYGDTRNNTVEIATAFLIKRVTESASHLKLVLLASYFSIANGGSRDDFAHTITRTLQLIKNVTQFENSISLVISKAPPSYPTDTSKEVFEDDIKKLAAKFMNGYRAHLQQQGSSEEKIQLIDALLKQTPSGDYPRISVFWRPNKPGRFDKIEKMVNARHKVRDSIINQSLYAKVQKSNNFGFPLTAEAQIEAGNLIKLTNDNIFNTLSGIVHQMKIELQKQIESTNDFGRKLQFISIGNKSIEFTNRTDAMTLDQSIGQFRQLIKALNLTSVNEMQFGECQTLQKNHRIFASLVASNGISMEQPKYAIFIQQISDFLNERQTETQNNILSDINYTHGNITSILKKVEKIFTNCLSDKFESLSNLRVRLQLIENATNKFMNQSVDTTTLNGLTTQIMRLTTEFNLCVKFIIGEKLKKADKLDIYSSDLITLLKNSIAKVDYQSFFKQISEFFITNTNETTNKINHVEHEIKKTTENFLNILSNIDRQIMEIIQNKLNRVAGHWKRLEWIQLGNNILAANNNANELQQRIELLRSLKNAFNITSINTTSLNQIELNENRLNDLNSTCPIASVNWTEKSSGAFNYLRSMHDWYSFLTQTYTSLARYEVQKDTGAYIQNELPNLSKRAEEHSVSQLHLDEFQEIIHVTLKAQLKYACVDNAMIINGTFAKSSDIQASKCPQGNALKQIKVYVVDTFFVDTDLNLNDINEIELHIFAHQWNILRVSTFYLNGKNGETKASAAGAHPREFGKNAGSFFGVANDVINGDLLTVELNGGNGVYGEGGEHQQIAQLNYGPHSIGSANGIILPLSGTTGTTSSHVIRELQSLSGINGVEKKEEKDRLVTYRLFAAQCCGGRGGSAGQFVFKNANEKANSMPRSSLRNGNSCQTFDLFVDVKRTRGYTVYPPSRRPNPNCPVFDPAKNSPAKQIDIAMDIFYYKLFLIENMKYFTFSETLNQAYDAVDQNIYPNLPYNIPTFVTEANELEKQFYRLNGYNELILMYDSLIRKIEIFSSTNATGISEVDRKILALLYSTMFSKTTSMRHRSDLIINIEDFLQLTLKNIKELDETGRKIKVDEQHKEYNDEIIEKIKEAIHFIKNETEPEVEKMFRVLDNEMNNTLTETIELQGQAKQEIEKKKENYRIMKRNMATRKRMGIFRAIGGIASFIPVAGPIINAAINAGTGIVEGGIKDPSQRPPFTVPLGVIKYLSELNKSNKDQLNAIESELSALKGLIGEVNSPFEKNLNNLLKEISLTKQKDSINYGKVADILKKGSEFLQKSASVEELGAKIRNRLEMTSNALTVIAQAFSVFEQYKNDNSRLNALAQAINADQNTLKSLMLFEIKIHTDLAPLIDALHIHLKNIESGLANNSTVTLQVVHWRVGKTLRAVQTELGNALTGFSTENSVRYTLVTVGEAINLIINIFSQVQKYEEHQTFVNYLTSVYMTDYKGLAIVDEKLRTNVYQMQFNLQANLVLSQYHRVVGAFKQAIFPYAEIYLRNYELPASLQGKDLANVTLAAATQVETLSKNIKEFNTTVVNKYDQRIHVAHFSNDAGSPGPFYLWRNHEVRDKIKHLFNGERIYLYADVSRGIKQNAVKLNKISLAINSNNQSINNQINDILKTAHVSLTHMGDSEYRCDNQVYTISSRPLTCKFSFDEKNHIPTDETVSCRKLRDGTAVLSPYVLWAVQLDRTELSRLEPFVDLVNIELHGYGQYLEDNAKICKTNLEAFYSIKSF